MNFEFIIKMSSMNARDAKGRFANTHPDKKYSRGRSKKRQKLFPGNSESDENVKKRRRTSASSKKMRQIYISTWQHTK